MDNQTIVYLFAETKKADPFETQLASHMYSEYTRREYPRANGGSVWAL